MDVWRKFADVLGPLRRGETRLDAFDRTPNLRPGQRAAERREPGFSFESAVLFCGPRFSAPRPEIWSMIQRLGRPHGSGPHVHNLAEFWPIRFARVGP